MLVKMVSEGFPPTIDEESIASEVCVTDGEIAAASVVLGVALLRVDSGGAHLAVGSSRLII